MRNLASIAAAALVALFVAGCASFHQTQRVKFVDDDGRFAEVLYGYGDKDHVTTWVSPINGKEIELKSKLRVKVALDHGPSFLAYQCMNTLGSGTMYRTDNERYMFLANGFTCAIFELEDKTDDYIMVFQGVLCQPPVNEEEENGR